MTPTTHHSPLTTHSGERRVGRVELALVLAITLGALLLRTAYPSRAAVEHFDEGVYASRLWFADGDDAPYPDRHLYAPPLVPWLVRWSIDLFGPGLWGAMLPALMFGTLTIPLVWWTARRWFGPAAGLAGAILSAGSDFHVLYSRTALTDATLCFWWLAAVYCAWESLRAGSFRWAVAGGMAAGLAWWTKYNGWLALVIAAAGALPWLISRRTGAVGRTASPSARTPDTVESGPDPNATPVNSINTGHFAGAAPLEVHLPSWRIIACWGVLATVAFAIWSPVLVGLQDYGGYGAVLENHRGYVGGPSHWWESLLRQAANHRLLDGFLSWGGVGLACVVPIAWRLGTGRGLTAAACCGTLLTAVLALTLAAGTDSTRVLALIAAGGTLAQHLSGRGKGRWGPDHGRSLAVWLLTAWFFGLLIVTPLYRAYPRLTLPWLIAAWLGAAAAIGRLATAAWWDRSARPSTRRVPVAAVCVLVLAWGLPTALSNWQRIATAKATGWQDRTAMDDLAGSIVSLATRAITERGFDPGARVPFVVYVYAEPALVFHLTERGVVAQPAGNLDFVHMAADQPRVPTFFVAGPHARRTPRFAEQWQQHGSRFELWFDARYTPSGLVLLNLHNAQELNPSEDPAWPDSDTWSRSRVAEPVRVYLVR